MNFSPNIWGPSFWNVIHYVALSYPEQPTTADKDNYKKFYYNLRYVLPCDTCKNNMAKHMNFLPIESYLEDNFTLFHWTIKLHNIVNIETGKREISYKEALNIYLNNNNINNNNNNKIKKQTNILSLNREKILIIIIISLIILLIINYIIKFKYKI